MKKGQVRIVTYEVENRKCNICVNEATEMITFILKDSRTNSKSAGFLKDDISWCSDETFFSCDEHAENIKKNAPNEMVFCSSFKKERFEHMFLFWKETGEQILEPPKNILM